MSTPKQPLDMFPLDESDEGAGLLGLPPGCPPDIIDGSATLTTNGETATVGDWTIEDTSADELVATFIAAERRVRLQQTAVQISNGFYLYHFDAPCNFGDATTVAASCVVSVAAHSYSPDAIGCETALFFQLLQRKSNGSTTGGQIFGDVVEDGEAIIADGFTGDIPLSMANGTLHVPGSDAGGGLTWTDEIAVALQLDVSLSGGGTKFSTYDVRVRFYGVELS